MLSKVIRDNLPSSFSGRVSIDDNEQGLNAQFTLSDSWVTILPLTKTAAQVIHKYSSNVGEQSNHHWFYGYSDANSAIAFLQNTPMVERIASGIDMGAGYFSTPMLVHGSTSRVQDVHFFDTIEFYDGVMKYLQNPGSFIKYDYTQRTISFKDIEECVHEYNAFINGEKIKVIAFTRANYEISYDIPDLKNNISSVLRFEFEERKSLDEIEKYYNYALKLFQFCTGRLNVRTNICLFDSKNTEDPFYVRFKDGYSDYANDKMQPLQQIRLLSLDDKLPKLLALLNDEKNKPYLEFLPFTNKLAGWVSYTQVIDLCVSFENEYELLDKEQSEELSTAASAFADELREYICNADVDNVIKQKACSIIAGNLKHFKPSLKERMFYIFDRYKDIMRKITEQRQETGISGEYLSNEAIKNLDHQVLGITKFFTDEEFKKKIRSFIEARGSIAHAGIKWNGSEEIFNHLVLLIYFSIFERAGYEKENTGKILSWLFWHRF